MRILLFVCILCLSFILAVPTAMSAVNFDAACNGISNISVNNQSILGIPVATGGIYIEGSYDGSDNEGKNVTSRGASCNQLNGNAGLPTPQYSMNFSRRNNQEMEFDIRIQSVPINFASMNVAFDFAKNLTESFRFDGSQLRRTGDPCIGLSGNRSSAAYREIRRVCTIPDTGGQRVGVAITANTPRWAEVSGSFGTARIEIRNSSHYRNIRFHNHPGTDNLDLAFGRMRPGESAFVQGVIKINSNTGTLTFEAESQLSHQIGRRDGNGWSVNVRDTPNRYLSYGPYTTAVPAGRRTAIFRLQLDNVTADNNRILTLDVYDADTGRTLATRELRRRDFNREFSYQEFNLDFNATAGNRLEFRVFWHGGSYVNQDKVTVR